MNGRYRVLFLMQLVLGHVTHAASLERVARADPDLDVIWVPVPYHRPQGLVERLPFFPPGLKGALRAAGEVQTALLRHRADAVVFNSPALATSATAWMRRLPTTISFDVTPRQFDREGVHFGHRPDRDGVVARWKHRVNRRVFARAAALAPWARWAAGSVVEEYGAAEAKIEVIPPGVDLAHWRPAAGRPAGQLPRVLFVGGDFHRKGGDLVTGWFSERGRERCRLTVVSADPAARSARAQGVEVRTDLRPNSEELRQLYRSSDVFVLPSRSEPFGIAAVEAIASGLPVVATDVGGLTDIVEDGVNGVVVPPGDGRCLDGALETLLADPARRRALGAAGRRLAEARFDERCNGQRLLALVKASVEARRQGTLPLGQEAYRR